MAKRKSASYMTPGEQIAGTVFFVIYLVVLPFATAPLFRLAERLLDVWVETNHISYTEMPVVFMESQHWLKKGMAFIERKFRKNWT